MLEFPLAPMGVLAPGSAHARPSACPPSTPAEIFRRTCLQSYLQTSHPNPQKSYPKFRNPRTTLKYFTQTNIVKTNRPTDRRKNIVIYKAAIAAKINHPYPNHNY